MTVWLEANLLLRHLYRKLAIAHTQGEAFDEFRDRIFAVGADQFGEGCEQAGLRQAIAIDAIVPCFRPGFVEIAQRRLLLFVVGQWIAGGGKGRWMAHETQQASVARSRAERLERVEVYHAARGRLDQFFRKG